MQGLSLNALAKRLGRNRGMVGKWRERSWWTWGGPPYSEQQAVEIEAKVKTLPADNNAPEQDGANGHSDPLAELKNLGHVQRAKLQLTIERSAKLKLERELLAGQYLRKEDVDRRDVGKVHAVKAAMLAVADSGVVEAIRNAETVQEAREVLRGRMIEVCQEFHRS